MEQVRNKNQVPWKNYPTPSWGNASLVVDEFMTEDVECNQGGYKVLPPGSSHPNTREFPNHRLLKEEGIQIGWNRRYWCNGFRNEDQYNYSIAYSGESNSHPIFQRRYLVRRDQYNVLAKESQFSGIYQIRIDVAGAGYDPEVPPTVTISGGGGNGATAIAVVNSRGQLDWIYLTSEGSGYTSEPNVVISGGGGASARALLNVDTGVVYSVAIINGGSSYETAPTVTFSGGSGSGAIAIAQVSEGVVVAVMITHYGSGYTSAPTVGFVGGGGSGATATATIVTATMRLVKEDVEELPLDDPKHSIYLSVTRIYETLPGPIQIDQTYDPYLDLFARTEKSIILTSTMPPDQGYVVEPAGQITEYKALSAYRTAKMVSRINPNALWENDAEDTVWYGTVPFSFPNEIPEDPIYRGIMSTSGTIPASRAIDLELTYNVIEGYSGPCIARFTRRYTVDPLDPDFLADLPVPLVINPQAHVIYGEYGFAGGNLIARVFAFQLPSALHPELNPQLEGNTDISSLTEEIPATEPPTIPRDEWICTSVKPEFSGRFKIWSYTITEILHPESTLFPPA